MNIVAASSRLSESKFIYLFMSKIIPLFRIFDYNKAVAFYIDWLGFEIIDKHSYGDNFPLYIQIRKGEIEIHLTEHHGDCSPGAKIMIENVDNLMDYHQALSKKDYKYNKPGIEQDPWNKDMQYIEVIDPFGNVIVFRGI